MSFLYPFILNLLFLGLVLFFLSSALARSSGEALDLVIEELELELEEGLDDGLELD